MKYAIIVLGEKFKDPELNDFIESAIRQKNTIQIFAPAIEHVGELGAGQIFDTIWIETTGCEKKQYIKAMNNLISLVFARARNIVFMPICPKEILEVAKEQWPGSIIWRVDFKDKAADPIRLFN